MIPKSKALLAEGARWEAISKHSDPVANADGSVDVYFRPTMPAGQEKNWIATVPGKKLVPNRFNGSLEPLCDKTWVLNDIEKVN